MAAHQVFSDKDQEGTLDIGGQELHYAMRGNLNGSHIVQQDRIGYAEIPDVPVREYQDLVRRSLGAAKQAVSKHPSRRNGGSTALTLLYDPKTFSLDIGQVGDSVAYLVVDIPGGRRAYLELTEHPANTKGDHSKTEGIPDDISQLGYRMWNAYDRTQPANPRERRGNLELTGVIKRLSNQFKLAPEDIKLSIFVASDGTVRADPNAKSKQSELVQPLDAAEGNAASRLFARLEKARKEYEAGKSSMDNLSGFWMPDIRAGKGTAVALTVCDGNADMGHQVSEVAATAITVEHAKCQEQARVRPR